MRRQRFMNMGDKRLSATIDDVDAVAHVMEMIAIHAQSAAPILLLGPRSTGASFLAEAIHACSARCDLPFVRARCGLYSGTLLEARLFGRSNPRNEYFLPTASRRKGVIGTAN